MLHGWVKGDTVDKTYHGKFAGMTSLSHKLSISVPVVDIISTPQSFTCCCYCCCCGMRDTILTAELNVCQEKSPLRTRLNLGGKYINAFIPDFVPQLSSEANGMPNMILKAPVIYNIRQLP